MGLIKLAKAFVQAKREFDAEMQHTSAQEKTLRVTPTIEVYGTIYHQKELARLKGPTVELSIRKTRNDDYYKSYAYQVYAGGKLVGGLNDYGFQHAAIRNMRATAYIDRNNPDPSNRYRLLIPRG